MSGKGNGKSETLDKLLDAHGTLYSEELGIHLARNTPSPLFRWLCASILFSARIPAGNATRAAKGLAKAGWRTPEKMADSSWGQRTRVLNENGYARFDESTSSMLGDVAKHMVSDYGGDLRRLRDKAGQKPNQERKCLKAFKGLGDTGVDIFFREAQIAWSELYPFADKKALQGAQKLGLGNSADDLAKLVDKEKLPVLVAALARMELAGDAKNFRH